MEQTSKKEVFQILDSGKVSITQAQKIKEYINHLLKMGSNQAKRRG